VDVDIVTYHVVNTGHLFNEPVGVCPWRSHIGFSVADAGEFQPGWLERVTSGEGDNGSCELRIDDPIVTVSTSSVRWWVREVARTLADDGHGER
jgi:hypothetical protein